MPDAQPAFSPHYTWTFPAAPVCFRLDLAVARDLRTNIAAAMAAHEEIWGVLLGWTDASSRPPATHIAGFDHVVKQRAGMQEAVASLRANPPSGLRVVGYFRSHMADRLYLDEDDLALIRELFPDPSNAFLVIRPDRPVSWIGSTFETGETKAGFFFWDNGRIETQFCFLEFALAEMEEAVEIATETQALEPAPVVEAPVRPVRRKLWPVVLLVGLMIGAGFGAYRWVTAQKVPPASQLGLHVERQGAGWWVSWNRNSPAIASARSANLSIREGGAPFKDLLLSVDQLRTGSVLYSTGGGELQFQLSVAEPNGEDVRESMLVLANNPPAVQAAASIPAPVMPPSPPPVRLREPVLKPVAVERPAPKLFTPPHSVLRVTQQATLLDPPPAVTGTSAAAPAFAPHLPPREKLPETPPTVAPALASAVAPTRPEVLQVPMEIQFTRLKSRPQLAYPWQARRLGISSIVRLAIGVRKDGTVESVRVLSGHALLREAAVESAWKLVYRPALMYGEAVRVSTEVEMAFRLP